MPSAFGRTMPLLRVLLVAAVVCGLGAGCTTSTPPPPETGVTGTGSSGAGSSTATVTPSTPTTSAPTGTRPPPTSGPTDDIGSDHFVPLRTTVPNSAQGKRIGLIGLDQTNPFSKLVSESIKEQATVAGAEIVYCDAENSAEVALRCARRLASQGVDAWVTFQPVSSAGESICAAGPQDVPMISIDGFQGDCQSSRVGTDDVYAGRLVGENVGAYVQQHLDCRLDTVILLSDPSRGITDRRRVATARTALHAFCPGISAHPTVTGTDSTTTDDTDGMTDTAAGTETPETPGSTDSTESTDSTGSSDSTVGPNGSGRTGTTVLDLQAPDQRAAFDTVGKALTSVPADGQVLIIGSNDGLTLGAVGAARAAGRLDQVYLAGIGGDPRSYCEIATDPHWLGDAGSFPEQYGRLVLPYLVDLMDHRAVPLELFLRNEFLDATNIAAHYDVTGCEPAR